MTSSVRPVLAIVVAMDEYQSRILGAAQKVLAERGLPLLVHCDGPLDRGARSSLLVAMLRNVCPVGLIQLNSPRADEQAELAELLRTVDAPVVHVGEQIPGAVCVSGDSAGGMTRLLAHLLDVRGARRPVLVRGVSHHRDSSMREAEFRRVMSERGLPVEEDLVITGEFMPEPTYAAMQELLSRRRDFDSVVALNDLSAVSAVSALESVGLRVPEDVAVCGYDNAPIATRWPGITTVDQELEEQGAAAARLLLEQVDDGGSTREIIVPSRVIVRGSTAPTGQPAIRDLDEVVGIAVADKEQLAMQDAGLALSDALNGCWTMEEVVRTVADHLHRLGIARCFLALHDRRQGGSADAQPETLVDTERARIVLAYRRGERLPLPAEAVSSHDLLPPELADELSSDMLVLQPLAVLDRPLGYLLFEQTTDSTRITALMRTELSRVIDAVLTTRDLRTHAQMLEQVVDRRTRELQAEVVTRQRAERELQRANAVLQRSAMLDGLTQIANRTAFEQHLERHWAAHWRDRRELAMLMVDVDAFKAYNDTYGHLAGDEALRAVADRLDQAVTGPEDLACRYGGEEFSVVLPMSGRTAALAVAERFRSLLEDAAIAHMSSPTGSLLTASIGIAVGDPGSGGRPETLIEAADRALYEAKLQGRDRVVVDGDFLDGHALSDR